VLKDRAILQLAFGETLVWAGLLYVFPATLLRWEADLGWAKSDLTLAITIAVLASAFAAPVAGRIIDKGLGPSQIGASTAIGGIALVLLSTVTELWQFYTLWLIIGFCLAGCLYEPCFAMVTRARGASAKQAITWITLVAGFAGTVSFPVVHFLSEAFGWRTALVIIGGFVTFIVAPILWSGAKNLGELGVKPKAESSQKHYLKSRVFWMLGLGFALIGLAHGATLHHLLPILSERGFALETAVLAAACIGPMQVVGRLAMVAVQSRVSSHVIALAAFASIAGSIIMLNFAGANVVMIGLFVLLFGSAYGTISILRPVIARDVLGEEAFGSKSGTLALMYLTASASSAYLGALIWGLGGYDAMLWTLIACVILGALTYAAARRLTRY